MTLLARPLLVLATLLVAASVIPLARSQGTTPPPGDESLTDEDLVFGEVPGPPLDADDGFVPPDGDDILQPCVPTQFEVSHGIVDVWEQGDAVAFTTTDCGSVIVGVTEEVDSDGDIHVVKTDQYGSELWSRRLGGPRVDYGTAVREDIDGGIILAGNAYNIVRGSHDIFVAKLDQFGGVVWQDWYGEVAIPEIEEQAWDLIVASNGNYALAADFRWPSKDVRNLSVIEIDRNTHAINWWHSYSPGTDNYAFALQEVPAGGYILTGTSVETSTAWRQYDVSLVRVDAFGDLVWMQLYDDGRGKLAFGRGVKVTADGGFIVGGNQHYYVDWRNEPFLLRTDALGAQTWFKTYPSDPTGAAWDVEIRPDGYAFTGYQSVPGNVNQDPLLAFTDLDGNELWRRAYGANSTYEFALHVEIPSFGDGFLITGGTHASDRNQEDVYHLRTDRCGLLGRREWERFHDVAPGDDSDQGRALALCPDGGVVVAASVSTATPTTEIEVIRYGALGGRIWTRRIASGTWSMPESIAVDAAGNAYIAGSTLGVTTGVDFLTARVNADGTLGWVDVRDNGAARDDFGTDVAIDKTGNVYVTGTATRPAPPFDTDAVTLKYAPSGSLLTAVAFDTPTHGDETANAIAINDLIDGAFVTGSTTAPGGMRDALTFRVQGSAVRWSRIFAGTPSGHDEGHDLAFDPSGFLYVVGETRGGTGSGPDYLLLKYQPLIGTFVWSATMDGPAGLEDVASSIAIDGARGQVWIAGRSDGLTGVGAQRRDYAAAQFTFSGALQCVGRFDGPAQGLDEATGVALAQDADGGVLVTGRSETWPEQHDVQTVRFDSSCNLEWSDRFTGWDPPPPNQGDGAVAIVSVAPSTAYVTGHAYQAEDPDVLTIKYVECR